MERYYIEIANIQFEVEIEEKFKKYYLNENYFPFFVLEKEVRDSIKIKYIYLDERDFEAIIPKVRWKKVGLAGRCSYTEENIIFLADVYYQGIVVGKKLIVCSKDMRRIKVFYNTDILQDHFYLELMIVINTILSENCDGIIFHCSGVIDNSKKKTFLFMGESGAGKSTIAELFSQGDSKFQVLSDDRVIVRREMEGYFAYGTPWVSDAKKREKIFGEVAGIFFLYHGKKLFMEQNERVKQKRKLIANIFDFPIWNNICSFNTFKFCDQLTNVILVRNLYFSLDSNIISYFEQF